MVLLVPLEHVVAATCHRPLSRSPSATVVCGGEPARAGGCTWVRGAPSVPADARGWDTLRQVGCRRARGSCRRCAGRGAVDAGELNVARDAARGWRGGGRGTLGQVQRSSHVHGRGCEHVSHPETRLVSKWRGRGRAVRRAGRGRGGVWVENACVPEPGWGGGGAEVAGVVAACCCLARWWPPTRLRR